MILLPVGQERLLAPLFAGASDTCVFSCLQGYMGRGWVDKPERPACGRIIVGDFCFFGGDCSAPGAPELVETAAGDAAKSFLICIPPDEGWSGLIRERVERPVRLERYAMGKTPAFDLARLRGYVARLGPEYQLRRMGRELYDLALSDSLTMDYVCNFQSGEDFVRRGLGYCVLHDGEMVAGASSYSVYDEGIEIEISTRADHRRKGLATACGARLILACLERHLYPNWDAANKESVALAARLGYTLDHAYPAYLLSK